MAHYQGQPVAVLGVNGDDDREAARAAAARHGPAKRSWWDGSSQGPIAAGWNVRYFPTVYVLDAQGVVRYKAHSMLDRELQAAVDALLRERGSL